MPICSFPESLLILYFDISFNRNPIILNGVETPNFNMFTSHITLHIPNTAIIQLIGDPKDDKKSANDSLAFFTLHELQKAGKCILKEQ